MQLYPIDLTKVKAIGHDQKAPLGTLQILLENDEGFEMKSIQAPVQALEGLKILSQIVQGETPEMPTKIPTTDTEYLKKITMIPTENLLCRGSSNIEAIGYDDTLAILKIDFHTGSSYAYFDVPYFVFTGMIKADSVGKYLNAEVKPKYEFQRLN